jgi:hypothetical protein
VPYIERFSRSNKRIAHCSDDLRSNSAFESGRADQERAIGLHPQRRAAQRERSAWLALPCTLAEDAAAALAIVLAKRDIDRTLLIQGPKENEDPPPRLEPKRSMRLMAAQLVGAAVIIVFAKVVAQNTPHWVGLVVVLGFLGYWLYRWFRKKE